MPTPTPLPENAAFKIENHNAITHVKYAVVSGLDAYQCVTDGEEDYGSNEDATITVLRDGVINSKGQFMIETPSYRHWDYLMIGDIHYSASNAPMNVRVMRDEKIIWKSDGSVEEHGWTICLEEYVAPTASPTLSPTGTCTVSFSSFIVLPAIAHV